MVTELESMRDDLSTQLANAKETMSLLEKESIKKEESMKEQQSAFDLMKEDYVCILANSIQSILLFIILLPIL